MDELDQDLKALETELKWLRPAAPSRRIWMGIDQAIAADTRPERLWAWVALPFAAALAVAVGVRHSFLSSSAHLVPPPGTAAFAAASPAFKPVSAEGFLVDARDNGSVTTEDGSQVRSIQTRYIDTITWVDPRDHASLRWSVPREETRVVPVSYQ